MPALRIVAVLSDIHPRAIVERGEQRFVVTYPECVINEAKPLPDGRLQTAVAKHGYQALTEAIDVDDPSALRAILEEYVDAGS